MANNQITPFQLTDQFTMDNFNQRINETNTALQKKAEFTLLWENASPTSAFAAQAIDLDLSTYNSVFVQAKCENGKNSWVSPVITPVGSGGDFSAFAASGAYDAYRFFGTSASNVNFGDASFWSETDNASYKDNRFLIPMRIYGVKGI